MKERRIFRVYARAFAIVALLAIGLVIFIGCPSDPPLPRLKTPVNYGETLNWGASFTPINLGLTPGNDTTELYLNWYSAGTTTGKVAHVRFIKGTREEGTGFIDKSGTVSTATSGYVTHKAAVTGLEPGYGYQYSVCADGTNWSPMYDYKIPAAGAFRFAAVADPQLTTASSVVTAWADTMSKIAAMNVSFIASAGDQVETPSINEAEYASFFAPPGLRSLPLAPVVGNHDYNEAFLHYFNMPNDQINTPAFSGVTTTEAMGNYFYRWNNALFVVLNNGRSVDSKTAAEAFITRFNSVLTNAKAAHTGKYNWLFVQYHKSTTSISGHASNRDIQYYAEAGLEELMTTHGVDFVFSGHDHVYTRSYPMTGKKDGTPSLPDKTQGGASIIGPNGTIYLTMTTASGVKYYGAFPTGGSNEDYPYLADGTKGAPNLAQGSRTNTAKWPIAVAKYNDDTIPGFTIVDVGANTVTLSTYHSNNTAAPHDTFTVTKQ